MAAWARLLALCSLALLHTHAFTFEVPGRSKECFLIDAATGEQLHGSFGVVFGGDESLSIEIRDPEDSLVFRHGPEKETSFMYYAERDGVYSACLSNDVAAAKRVVFHAYTSDEGSYFEAHRVVNQVVISPAELQKVARGIAQAMSPLERSVDRLSSAIQIIADGLELSKTRERHLRNTSESTNARVLWWHVFFFIAVGGFSLYQIWSYRTFFESTRKV